jgi:exopolysaccharide biosynthesis protein
LFNFVLRLLQYNKIKEREKMIEKKLITFLMTLIFLGFIVIVLMSAFYSNKKYQVETQGSTFWCDTYKIEGDKLILDDKIIVTKPYNIIRIKDTNEGISIIDDNNSISDSI